MRSKIEEDENISKETEQLFPLLQSLVKKYEKLQVLNKKDLMKVKQFKNLKMHLK